MIDTHNVVTPPPPNSKGQVVGDVLQRVLYVPSRLLYRLVLCGCILVRNETLRPGVDPLSRLKYRVHEE